MLDHGRKFLLLTTILILAAAASCSLPSAPPDRTETPTAMATATLSPTLTATPSQTPLPIATETITATPLPANFALALRWDGPRLVDDDGGYTMKLPSGWTAEELRADNTASVLGSSASANASLVTVLKMAVPSAAVTFRIYGHDLEPSHRKEGVAPNVVVIVALLDAGGDLNWPELLGALTVRQVRTFYPDAKITQESSSRRSLRDIPVTSVGFELPMALDDGSEVQVYKRISYLETPTAIVILHFTSSQARAAEMWYTTENVINSIRILGPGE